MFHCWESKSALTSFRRQKSNKAPVCEIKMYAPQRLIEAFRRHMPAWPKTVAICYLLRGATVKISPKPRWWEKKERQRERRTCSQNMIIIQNRFGNACVFHSRPKFRAIHGITESTDKAKYRRKKEKEWHILPFLPLLYIIQVTIEPWHLLFILLHLYWRRVACTQTWPYIVYWFILSSHINELKYLFCLVSTHTFRTDILLKMHVAQICAGDFREHSRLQCLLFVCSLILKAASRSKNVENLLSWIRFLKLH